MSCSVPVTITGTASDSSEKTQIKQGLAFFVSKGVPTADTPLRFSSYAEKYAYYRGKAACVNGSTYPCNMGDLKTA